MARRRWAFALLPLLVLVAGGEGALRLAGWPKADLSKLTHATVYWVDPGSRHLEPIAHKETGGTFKVSTDANGLRAPLHPEEKPAGITRVMTLGCSTTYGWGVDDEQSYPARLEAHLVEQGHPIEVINGGQPGYSSFQGLWLWDNVLSRYHPDVVIFGYIVQDARSVAYSDRSQAILQGNADYLKQNLLYHSKLYLALLDGWRAWQMRAKESAADSVYRVPPDEYVENIRAFKARAEAVGARFVLFGFPLERAGYTAEHRAILHSAAEILPAPLYDPQPEMEAASAGQTLYFPQDRGHANADGLDWIARGMAEFLVREKLVP